MVDEMNMNIEMTMPVALTKSWRGTIYPWTFLEQFEQIDCWPTGRIVKVYDNRQEIMQIEVSYEHDGINDTVVVYDTSLSIRASTGLI